MPKTRSDFETRTVPVTFEARSASEPRIKGHAALFDRWSEDLGGFREKILPGAFTKTLNESDVRMLWDHNSMYVLGRRSAGTLSLMEDSQGLYFENMPPDTTWFRDLSASMERGDVKEMSFGFRVVKDRWDEKYSKRELLEVQLVEISVVTFPAYPATSAKLRDRYPGDDGLDLENALGIVWCREHGQAPDAAEETVLRRIGAFFLRGLEPAAATPAPDEPSPDTRWYQAWVDAVAALAARKTTEG